MCKKLYGCKIVPDYDDENGMGRDFDGIVIASRKYAEDMRIFKRSLISNVFKLDLWIEISYSEYSKNRYESGKAFFDFLIKRVKEIASANNFDGCEIAISKSLAAYIEALDAQSNEK